MAERNNVPGWWGAPRKFNPNIEERKISWLELFYDLVYVIAISRITQHLCEEFTLSGFLWYCSLFILIFWGWLNGSLYHDLHGNAGLRTRLMTLWQMVIISALSVTIDQNHGAFSAPLTVVLMIMQLYITYLWWSVGFYDKDHRQYNRPYTFFFLISFALLGVNLIVNSDYRPYLIAAVIIFNYLPPFIASRILRHNSLDLPLSASMTERLGLFTIILFGEVVLGVVNGAGKVKEISLLFSFEFILVIAIAFVLWWVFFTLISNRNAKTGFVKASWIEILYIPSLLSLGLLAASFCILFTATEFTTIYGVMCLACGIFFSCISLMMRLLIFPEIMAPISKKVRGSLFITALIFWALIPVVAPIPPQYFLLLILFILLTEIIYLNSLYYSLRLPETQTNNQD